MYHSSVGNACIYFGRLVGYEGWCVRRKSRTHKLEDEGGQHNPNIQHFSTQDNTTRHNTPTRTLPPERRQPQVVPCARAELHDEVGTQRRFVGLEQGPELGEGLGKLGGREEVFGLTVLVLLDN